MSDEIRINRTPQAQPQSAMKQDMSVPGGTAEPQKSSKMPWVVLAVVVVVLVVLGVLFRERLFKGAGNNNAPAAGQASGYQAVFLTNGQVYFGKLANANSDYPILKDIFYLQVVQPPLQGNQQGQSTSTSQQQPQISLVKLGNELHGPVDEMHISRAQILFYEDLKSDGQVVKAIDAYKANPSGTAAPAQQQPTPSTPTPAPTPTK